MENEEAMLKEEKIIAIIGVMISLAFLVGAIFTVENTYTPNFTIGNLRLDDNGNGAYSIIGNIVPTKNFDFVGMGVMLYNANNELIGEDDEAWNMYELKSDQRYAISTQNYAQTPAKSS